MKALVDSQIENYCRWLLAFCRIARLRVCDVGLFTYSVASSVFDLIQLLSVTCDRLQTKTLHSLNFFESKVQLIVKRDYRI